MEYELYHYGVKGMKWGVRKSVEAWRQPSAVKRNRMRAEVRARAAKNAKTQYMRDYYSGRAARINRKADNIAARERGDKEASKRIMQERVVRALLTRPATEGRAERYKKQGDSVLMAYGKATVAEMGYNVAVNAAAKVVKTTIRAATGAR